MAREGKTTAARGAESKAKAKPKAAPKAPKEAVKPDGAQPPEDLLHAKDMLEPLVTATGLKKAQVKAVQEALFQQMLVALEAGKSLHLPGLGRLRPVAKPEGKGGGALTLKLKRLGGKKVVGTPLAPTDEES